MPDLSASQLFGETLVFQQNMSLLEDENQTMEEVGVEENAQILIEGANCSDILLFAYSIS